MKRIPAAVLLLGLAACDNNSVLGYWVSTLKPGHSMEFKQDGIWIERDVSWSQAVTGRYTIDGQKMKIEQQGKSRTISHEITFSVSGDTMTTQRPNTGLIVVWKRVESK